MQDRTWVSSGLGLALFHTHGGRAKRGVGMLCARLMRMLCMRSRPCLPFWLPLLHTPLTERALHRDALARRATSVVGAGPLGPSGLAMAPLTGPRRRYLHRQGAASWDCALNTANPRVPSAHLHWGMTCLRARQDNPWELNRKEH